MHWMVMPFRRYVDFQGRSRRMEFWMWQLFCFIVNSIFSILVYGPIIAAFASLASASGYSGRYRGPPTDADMATALFSGFGIFALIMGVLWMIWGLATLLPNLAVAVRRLHDSNRTGWWAFYPWIAYFAGYFILIVVAVAAGAAAGRGDAAGAAVIVAVLSVIMFVAFFGLGITVLVFWFLDGTRGPNRFGPDPKGGERGYDQTFA